MLHSHQLKEESDKADLSINMRKSDCLVVNKNVDSPPINNRDNFTGVATEKYLYVMFDKHGRSLDEVDI